MRRPLLLLAFLPVLAACGEAVPVDSSATFSAERRAQHDKWVSGCNAQNTVLAEQEMTLTNCPQKACELFPDVCQRENQEKIVPQAAASDDLVMLAPAPLPSATFSGAFDEGQCTWFVAEEWKRLYQDDITRFPANAPRHAKTFPQLLGEQGYTVDTIPSVGSIAVFIDGTFAEYGHVAIVREVYGKTMRVKQSNYPEALTVSEQDYDVARATAFIHPKNEKRLTLTQGVTAYNPEVAQNDADPRTGAAGVTMREGMMALSRDLLAPTKAHPEWNGPIPYGTRVTLSAPGHDERCNATYEVQDTMNKRFKAKGDVFRESRSGNFSCPSGTVVLYQ